MYLCCSDLHLSQNTPAMNDLFVAFLQTIAELPIQGLYLLGDWLDAWVGDCQAPWLAPIKAAIAECTFPIFFISGNRDVLFSSSDAKTLGVKHLGEEVILNPLQTQCLHGDQCSTETGYLRYRKIVNSLIFKKLFSILPMAWRAYLALRMRRHSQKKHHHRDNSALQFSSYWKAHCHTLVHGHTHCNAWTYWPQRGKQVHVLDAWSDTCGHVMLFNETHRWHWHFSKNTLADCREQWEHLL